MNEQMLKEMRSEAATTKRLLARVPTEKLSWKPHPKSMSLGQLALHVAQIPGNLSELAKVDEFDAGSVNFDPAQPSTSDDILKAFDTSVSAAEEYLKGLTPEAGEATWRMTLHGKEVFSLSRAEFLRTVMLNHWYHHRGQLTVYLRLLDVPLPVIYGRSADESPFG